MGWQEALHSWELREVSGESPWRPVIYPFKTVIPVACALLILQGASEFAKSAWAALKGREL
jgi:TRAP-type mannitol/chloroaromatic compound transport system permease small subunit